MRVFSSVICGRPRWRWWRKHYTLYREMRMPRPEENVLPGYLIYEAKCACGALFTMVDDGLGRFAIPDQKAWERLHHKKGFTWNRKSRPS